MHIVGNTDRAREKVVLQMVDGYGADEHCIGVGHRARSDLFRKAETRQTVGEGRREERRYSPKFAEGPDGNGIEKVENVLHDVFFLVDLLYGARLDEMLVPSVAFVENPVTDLFHVHVRDVDRAFPRRWADLDLVGRRARRWLVQR